MDDKKREELKQKMIDLQYEYEERVAIMEYDGGLSRSEAEKRAKTNLNWQRLVRFQGASTNLRK